MKSEAQKITGQQRPHEGFASTYTYIDIVKSFKPFCYLVTPGHAWLHLKLNLHQLILYIVMVKSQYLSHFAFWSHLVTPGHT